MTEQPTPYDLQQDEQIRRNTQMIKPSYDPSGEIERSFPVVGEGIDSRQYELMSLPQGSGVVITDDGEHSHQLTLLPGGVAETNARNQLLLKVSQNTGRGETVMGGSYHVFYEDMLLDFPPVTSPTTYHVCVTKDPEKENDPGGPARIRVWPGEPPRSRNRTHVVLHTVHREPNQLLSDAVRQLHRQYVSPTITAVTEEALPDPTDVLYGTLGIVRSRTSDGNVVPGTGSIFESRGVHGWHNLLVGDWYHPSLMNSWTNSSSDNRLRVRQTPFGIQFRGRVAKTATRTYQRMAILPNSLTPSGTPRFPVAAWPHTDHHHAQIDEDGSLRIMEKSGVDAPYFVNFDGLFLPLT